MKKQEAAEKLLEAEAILREIEDAAFTDTELMSSVLFNELRGTTASIRVLAGQVAK